MPLPLGGALTEAVGVPGALRVPAAAEGERGGVAEAEAEGAPGVALPGALPLPSAEPLGTPGLAEGVAQGAALALLAAVGAALGLPAAMLPLPGAEGQGVGEGEVGGEAEPLAAPGLRDAQPLAEEEPSGEAEGRGEGL